MVNQTFKKNYVLLAFFLIFTFIYAFLRYNIFGETPFNEIPTFIANKAISFTLTIWLMVSFWNYQRNSDSEYLRKQIEIIRQMAFMHIFLSILVLSERLIPKFFGPVSYSLWGGLSLLAGVIATSFLKFTFHKTQLLVFLLLFKLHLFFMGFQGWIKPQSWPGYMPPITLLCFLIVLITDYIVLKTNFPEQSKS